MVLVGQMLGFGSISSPLIYQGFLPIELDEFGEDRGRAGRSAEVRAMEGCSRTTFLDCCVFTTSVAVKSSTQTRLVEAEGERLRLPRQNRSNAWMVRAADLVPGTTNGQIHRSRHDSRRG